MMIKIKKVWEQGEVLMSEQNGQTNKETGGAMQRELLVRRLRINTLIGAVRERIALLPTDEQQRARGESAERCALRFVESDPWDDLSKVIFDALCGYWKEVGV